MFVYETFLYTVAALLKTRSYIVLHDVFTSHYLRPKADIGHPDKFQDFGCFCGHAEVVEPALSPPDRQKFKSPAAELIKRQADRSDLPFSAVIEAELVVFLMALLSSTVRWIPQTLHYASQSDFPFFIRAAQHRNFLKLATITGIDNADALREKAMAGYKRLNVNQWYEFAFISTTIWGLLNMDDLDTVK